MTSTHDLKLLTKSFLEKDAVKECIALVKKSSGTQVIEAQKMSGSMAAILVKHLVEQSVRPALCILADEDACGYFYNDLVCLMGEDQAEESIFLFPSLYKRHIKYGQKDDVHEVLRSQARIALENARNKQLSQAPIIVSYADAILEKVALQTETESKEIKLQIGSEINRKDLRERLWKLGFTEKDYVDQPGTFAFRGSLVDVFSFTNDEPVRIDFFGDEVESIRSFDVVEQTSIRQLSQVTLCPSSSLDELSKGCMLLDLLPQQSVIYVESCHRLQSAFEELYESTPVHPESNLIHSQELLQSLLATPSSFFKDLWKHDSIISPNSFSPLLKQWKKIDFQQEGEPMYHKDFDLLIKNLEAYKQQKHYSTYIMSGQESQLKRLASILQEKGSDIRFKSIIPTLHKGFVDHELKLVLLTDHSIFERFHRYSNKVERIKQNMAELTLKEIQGFDHGDYVVHINHGIGQFAGLVTMEQNGKVQEYVRVNYKDGDSIYVSIHALDHLSKYKSKDNDTPPPLNRLGSKAWDNMKDRTKKKIKSIARGLIKLYAERMLKKGFAFSPDSYLQQELESSFIYEDTPDQERTTEEVKNDMEKEAPMDRLICGDVGFGKTEIAIRAAFKAATDGKQVAVLVPTTVLAYQHYQTFKSRLKEFPVEINYLSRAKTAKEQREILSDLESGKLDIIIGTHKLVSKKIKFKDLGLLIIDEEQKFGVVVKEKLRQMRAQVDTLTMTATPIPRTLQFSLMGARDMSLLKTAPPNRQPIKTELSLYDIDTIKDAINFEMARGGQVYFVSNRISKLADIAKDIKKAIPDVRIGVAHGQMPPKETEKILLGFVQEEYDVLLSTAIIENGIDVPNANTIIINDAHQYGLSDLHQLRGRVGRSNIKAFCYLLSPPIDYLSPDANKRLTAISSFSELGSGIHIAMQDLDIRGAGNMLGAEQSGFIANIGYVTYQRLLEEAFEELQEEELLAHPETEQTQKPPTNREAGPKRFVKDVSIDTDIEAYFPDTYVPGSIEKLNLYKELDEINTDAGMDEYISRLQDRFGTPPPQAMNILEIVRIKWKAQQLGVERLVLKNGKMILYFVSNPQSPFYKSNVFLSLLQNPILRDFGMQIQEQGKKRLLRVPKVKDIKQASKLLSRLLNQES